MGGLTNNKVGLVQGGHYPADLVNTQADKSAVNFAFDTYYYWYIPSTPGMEFFAEAFNYGVRNIDTEPTKKIFGKSYSAYEAMIKNVYGKIPHIDI